MTEVLVNQAPAVLASPVTSGAGTFTRTSTTSGWPGDSNGPASANFRCVMTDGTNYEIVLVTGGFGTATLTISRAVEPTNNGVQTAFGFAAGSTVTPIATAEFLLSLAAGGISHASTGWSLSVTGLAIPSEGGVNVPVDTVNNTYTGWDTFVTWPTAVMSAGTVLSYDHWSVQSIDTTNDAWDMITEVLVTNADGSENLYLTGTAQAHAGVPGDSCSVTSADLSVSASSGSDLSYDSATGQVTSAAGGTYAVTAKFEAEWD